VYIHSILSDVLYLLFGVSHGSVIGPLVFTMYTRSFGIIALRYGVKYHLYTDDTQVYISLDPDNELNVSSSLMNLEHCIADIRLWKTQNILKLNYKKQILYILHYLIVLTPKDTSITDWCIFDNL